MKMQWRQNGWEGKEKKREENWNMNEKKKRMKEEFEEEKMIAAYTEGLVVDGEDVFFVIF